MKKEEEDRKETEGVSLYQEMIDVAREGERGEIW